MKILYFVILIFFLSGSAHAQLSTEPVKADISLYPNPATSTLWIKITNKKVKQEDIHVYNIIGNKLDLKAVKTEEGNFSIEVEGLPAGYYLLVIENEETHFTKTIKFLKK